MAYPKVQTLLCVFLILGLAALLQDGNCRPNAIPSQLSSQGSSGETGLKKFIVVFKKEVSAAEAISYVGSFVENAIASLSSGDQTSPAHLISSTFANLLYSNRVIVSDFVDSAIKSHIFGDDADAFKGFSVKLHPTLLDFVKSSGIVDYVVEDGQVRLIDPLPSETPSSSFNEVHQPDENNSTSNGGDDGSTEENDYDENGYPITNSTTTAAEAPKGVNTVVAASTDGVGNVTNAGASLKDQNESSPIAVIKSNPLVGTIADVTGDTQNQSDATWNLSRIWRRKATTSNLFKYNKKSGQNVDAYVIDSGIFTAHQEFDSRASTGTTLTTDGTADTNGHGSHVAGIIGGRWKGVAKNVNLIAVKVLGSSGTTDWSTVISAMEWVVNQAKATGRPSIINMSLSGDVNQAVNDAIASTIAAGVHVVVAAGNKYNDACQYSPSSAKGAVVVGSISQGDSMSSFSNFGSCITLFAPGNLITSVGLGGTANYAVMSGTSMASPHVAGAIAVLLSQRNMKPADMKAYLVKISTKNTCTAIPSSTTNRMLYLPINNI